LADRTTALTPSSEKPARKIEALQKTYDEQFATAQAGD
jgi:hypothetical protein